MMNYFTQLRIFLVMMCIWKSEGVNVNRPNIPRKQSIVQDPWDKIHSLVREMNKILKLPNWKSPNIGCQTDQDCPAPFACCHDPFFPFSQKYCCTDYKTRSYDPVFILNIIQP